MVNPLQCGWLVKKICTFSVSGQTVMSHNPPLQVEVDIFGGRVKLRRFMSHIVHSKEIQVNQLRTVKKYDQQSAL